MKKIIFLSLIASSILYADVVGIKQYIVDAGNYKINYEGKEREFLTGINPGYGSALTFKGEDKDGNLEFYAVTDRDLMQILLNLLKMEKSFQGNFSQFLILLQV